MSMKITAHTTKAPLMSQNMLIVRSQTMLTSDHKLCSRQITDYAHVRSQTMLTSDHSIYSRQNTNYAHGHQIKKLRERKAYSLSRSCCFCPDSKNDRVNVFGELDIECWLLRTNFLHPYTNSDARYQILFKTDSDSYYKV